MPRVAVTNVPRVRPVVIVRDSRLDGHTEEVGLRVPVKEPTSCGHPRAHERYIGVFTLCAATFIGDFFPPDPLPWAMALT